MASVVSCPAAASAQQRFALIIGVSDYGREASLPNPVNDANLIAKTLRSIGFRDDAIQLLPNPTKGQIRNALNELYNKVQAHPDAFVMIYFAGHAVQLENVNYLLPRGIDLLGQAATPGDYDDQGFNAQLFVNKLSRSRANDLVVIIDACRDNPFGGSPGLAELTGSDTGPNSVIAFSAMAGQTAADGRGANGPYAVALAAELRTPDRTLTQVFEGVKDRFATNPALARQRPYSKGSSSLRLFETPVSGAEVASLGAAIVQSSAQEATGEKTTRSGDIAELVGLDRIAGGDDGRILLKEALARRPLAKIRQEADAGDGFSLYLMGLATWDGLGGAEKDLEKAAQYLRLSVARGSGRAASAFGVYLCCTVGGPKNDREAAHWFRVGDVLNSPSATRNLAISYRDGTGVDKNIQEAIRLLNRAGEKGSGQAWSNLGWIYNNDDYGMRNKEKARLYFEKGLEKGDFSSIEAYANDFQFGVKGDGSDKAPDRALSIYVRAANAGCGHCWRFVAQMYAEGVVGEADPVAAYAAYSKAADAGDAASMLAAARLLKSGKGVDKSPTAAYALYERARAAGSPEGTGSVGQALARGEAVPRDPARAAGLLREVLAFDLSSDLETRHAVYAPNYWGYAHDLAKLLAADLVAPASPTELADLRARYGSETANNMKRFTVPIVCGDRKVPFHIYIIDWSRPNDETSLDSQAEWLKSQRGCTVPTDVSTSFTKLKRIASENKVSFVDLTVYALGAAQKEEAASTASKGQPSEPAGGAPAPDEKPKTKAEPT
ncbi:DUF2610 domain-containing protein [Phenylobacterium sp.]|uniref:DUF2610 domain-containing protein n=1 Tax=Phenylobacterium sp. TaxID=1871053 RepID=UPI00286A39F2|nr:DUF2610 domain-containing protein [Phenylobacterium sp.]